MHEAKLSSLLLDLLGVWLHGGRIGGRHRLGGFDWKGEGGRIFGTIAPEAWCLVTSAAGLRPLPG